MTTLSPKQAAKKTDFVTFWELFERAAQARYGDGIRVIKTPFYRKKVKDIISDFELSVVAMEKEPREATRTIVDINMKEYTNNWKEGEDETIVKVLKKSTKLEGHKYSFSTTKGVDFGIGGNIGAQVMGMAVAGGSLGLSGTFNKSKSTTKASELQNQTGFEFSYDQEEKITVPDGTQVKAKIITYAMKYEMRYTLKFRMPLFPSCTKAAGRGGAWGCVAARAT